MKIIRGADLPLVPASHEDQLRPGVLKRVLAVKGELFEGQVQMINWAVLPGESAFQPHYHQDMEDILAVVDGRPECVAEVADGIAAVSGFIRQHFRIMLSTPDFLSALPGHTGGHERSEIVLKRLKSIL